MIDASLALQGAIYKALSQHSELTALVADRIYDDAPDSTVKPFVSFGQSQTLTDDFEGGDGVDVTFDVDAYSAGPGMVEVRRIAGAIRTALNAAPLMLASPWRLVEIKHRDTRFMTEPDRTATHAVLTFRALIDPL